MFRGSELLKCQGSVLEVSLTSESGASIALVAAVAVVCLVAATEVFRLLGFLPKRTATNKQFSQAKVHIHNKSC